VFGVLPRSSSPVSSGGAGQRWGPLPHRRPWRAAFKAGSDRSFVNKLGSGGSGLRGRGRRDLSRCRRSGGMGRDPAAPVLWRLDPRRRLTEPGRSTSFAGLGGQGWSCSAALLPLFCAAVFLLLPPLLVGLGGEGQGVGRGDAADVRGSSVEVFGRDASRFAPLCSVLLPWGRRPELLSDVKPSSNKRCLPVCACTAPSFLLLAGCGGGGEDDAFGVSAAPIGRRQVSVDAVRQVNLHGEAAWSSNSMARAPLTSAAVWQQLQGSSSSAPARRLAPVLVLNLLAGRQLLPIWTWEEEVPVTSQADLALSRESSTKAKLAAVIFGHQRPPRAVMCSWHHGFQFLQWRRIFELKAASRVVGDPSGVVPGVVGGGRGLISPKSTGGEEGPLFF
jgi:hypothetical protein